MEELREQVEAYERLNAGRSREVVLEAVDDLPKAPIRARIAAGLTQEGLARRLGVKAQQVQRLRPVRRQSSGERPVPSFPEAIAARNERAYAGSIGQVQRHIPQLR